MEDIFVRRAVSRADLITAPSRRAVDEIRRLGYVEPESVQLEPNLMKLDLDNPTPVRSGTLDVVRLLFAGRFSEQKGLDRIPEMLRATSHPVHVRLMGDGEEAERVRSMAEAQIGPHTIEVIGYGADVRDHLDWCDAVLLPSRWELNPVVIWEALARGRGTIASHIQSMEDLAASAPIWLFGSESEFAQVVAMIACDEPLRAETYRAARELAEDTNEQRSAIVEYLAG
jgi:glycosyltransferase involved in cell wall biosynthesis